MSIKFHSNDHVSLILRYYHAPLNITSEIVHINVELGPIINRSKCGWSTYQLIVPEHIDVFKIFNPIYDIDKIITNKIYKIDLDYQSFKSHIKEFKARELADRFYPASDNDLLDDLDFINDEITHIKIQMNLMKQKNEIDEYNFYENLLHNNTHLIFQLPSKEAYDRYIDKIIKIRKIHFQEQFNQKIREIASIRDV